MLILLVIFPRILVFPKVVKRHFSKKIQSIAKSRADMPQLTPMNRSHLKAWSHLKVCKRKINKKTWSNLINNKLLRLTEISSKKIKTLRTLTLSIYVLSNSRQKNLILRTLMSLHKSWEKSPRKRREKQSSSTKTLVKFPIKKSHCRLKILILLHLSQQTL